MRQTQERTIDRKSCNLRGNTDGRTPNTSAGGRAEKTVLKVLAILALGVMAQSGFAMTVPDAKDSTLPPFTCTSNFYEAISGQLALLNPSTGVYDPIGAQQTFYNAVGYNVLDDYSYGLEQSSESLVRIGSNGVTEPVFENIASSASGDMDRAGNLYYRFRPTQLRSVNVTTGVVSNTTFTVNGTAPGNVLDASYINNGTVEAFVGARDGALSIYNLTTLESSSVSIPGLPSGAYGASWGVVSGTLFVSSNTDGRIFEISDPLGTPTLVGFTSAEESREHDGFNCGLANAPISSAAEPIIGAAKSAGSVTDNSDGTFSVTYTLLAENAGPTNLFDIQITDDLTAAFGAPQANVGDVDTAGEYFVSVGAIDTSGVTNGGDTTFAANPAYNGSGTNTTLLDVTQAILQTPRLTINPRCLVTRHRTE